MNIDINAKVQTVRYIRALKKDRTDVATAACKQMFITYGCLLTDSQYEECFNILYGEENNT